jgi:ATP-dependent Clp protease ATP-binding subunit ClpA
MSRKQPESERVECTPAGGGRGGAFALVPQNRLYLDIAIAIDDALPSRLPVKPLIPSSNRYTHNARRALAHTTALARALRHPAVDSGHLLGGVLHTTGSAGQQALYAMGMSEAVVWNALNQLYPQMQELPDDIPNSSDLNAALAFAADEAAHHGDSALGTEHLLLGITRANIGGAPVLLRALKLSSDQLRRRARATLETTAREPDLQAAKRNARLSELSRRVIGAAEQVAVERDHLTVGVGHLLWALAQEERSATAALLRTANLDETGLIALLDAPSELFLVGLEGVMGQSLEQATRAGSHYTGTEHLLLTLAAVPEGIALVSQLGVDATRLRRAVRAHLNAL